MYSEKFAQVQNFMELPMRVPEEICAVLIFTAPTRTERRGAIDTALVAIFAFSIFVEANLFAQTAKFCTTQKFSVIGY